ncbi:hypothetical protein O181_006735 [Austropuccinia psidii MF-1]|uniref:Uncharacterized protein n=1 Tax=Austropuccinia psidii MF-1 TaxID=1389203 RepID=A0A9Q3GH57_9BASI|nr:hypothetical protein [Austropuccinia psidii MF-1]
MPVQHSPPARQKISQARAQAIITPTPTAALDGTPEIPQLRVHLDRGTLMEGGAPSRKEGRGPGEDGEEEEEENAVEGEESDGNEGVPAPVRHPKLLEGQL